MLCSIRKERSYAPPQKRHGHVGHQVRARAHVALGAEYSTFVAYSAVGRTCSKTACLIFLCLLPMVLKARGLGIGATFMRGNYVADSPGFVNALC